MEIKGYHGTSIENAKKILETSYKLSNEKEWFGAGVYFFENFRNSEGITEAKNWAIHVKSFAKWAVLESLIISEKFIDLVDNIEHKKMFQKILDMLAEKHKKSNIKGNFKEKLVYKELEKLDIDLIRALVEAKRKPQKVYTILRPQIQICVKNLDCIRYTKIIYTSED